jgi:phosphotransferase system HPr-like phosphotransfer protein
MSIVNIEISPFDYLNFKCRRQDAFEKNLEVLNDDGTPFDFTGYTALMQVRKKSGSEVVIEFDSEDGSITLLEGEILIEKDSIDVTSGSYVYDLQLTSDGKRRTIITGNFVVTADLTE